MAKVKSRDVKSAKPRQEDDLELVRRFQEGDEEAFDRIFEAYSARLLGFLTRMCGNAEDGRESLQETFLTIFRYLKGFRAESSLKNWVFKIAVTTCLKKKRKTEALQRVESLERGCPGPGITTSPTWQEGVGVGDYGKWGEDPEQLLVDREFQRAIVQGVASMPYIYKIAINLRDFEGFSTEETSRILGIKVSTVKVRLHRARLYLQEWLKKNYAG